MTASVAYHLQEDGGHGGKRQEMDQLLVALDVDTRGRALELANLLRGTVGGFKIGSRLFTSEGPSLVSMLVDRGDRVFLDLKYHDIPSVVAQGVRAAARLGTWMLTVHATGGRAMLVAAADAARQSDRPPIVVGVTVLTSFDDAELARIGVTRPLPAQVESLAELAVEAGLDGVVASPLEVERLRARIGPAPTIVTPGIRGGGAGAQGADDQVRTLGPRDALSAGATYLVIGRPIIEAPDPLASARAIARQLDESPPCV
jgi:orotidine-5'-phosphate decarboxylase